MLVIGFHSHQITEMIWPFYIPFHSKASALQARGELVVLLHGIFNSGFRLFFLHRRLLREGYDVLNISYPSHGGPIEEIASHIAPIIARKHDPNSTLHLVGYSMGGLVARAYLMRDDAIRPRSLLCIGSPNQGTTYVDEVLKRPLTAWIFRILSGKPGSQMATSSSFIASLGPAHSDVTTGVIAGDGASIIWPKMPRHHDGKVPVACTRIEGMADHITIRIDHVMMVFKHVVLDQMIHFLKDGRFSR